MWRAWIVLLALGPLVGQSRKIADLAAGKVLVASRTIGDPHFAQTVILLAIYDDQGGFGLTLNRRSDTSVAQAFPALKEARKRNDLLYLGGPVETGEVFGLLETSRPPNDGLKVLPNTYLLASATPLERAIQSRAGATSLHLFRGYTGWSKAQLLQEVGGGQWYIFPADKTMIFTKTPELLWAGLIAKADPRRGSGALP